MLYKLFVLSALGLFSISANVDSNAIDYLKLYSQYDTGNGYTSSNQHWYLKNKHKNRAIKVTILFRSGGDITGNGKWTKSFTLEPGEIKNIGYKRSSFTDGTTSAKINGARFL